MNFQADTQTVTYNDLLMQHVGGNVLFCGDDGAIINWLSSYQYPREFLTQDCTNTVVFLRDDELDLIIVNNFQQEGDKGLTVGVWLDFVGHQTDLRYLGRPYDGAHQTQYHDIWNNIVRFSTLNWSSLLGGGHIDFEKASRPASMKGFVPIAKRWVVERSLAWTIQSGTNFFRRLVKDYEYTVSSSASWLYLANLQIMSQRI